MMMKERKTSSMIPKYEQIKQDLLEEIKNHHFIPGDKFYSEADDQSRIQKKIGEIYNER